MRTFTAGQLVTKCQRRCDMENQGLISTSEWKEMLSTQYAELYAIVAEMGLRYFETTATITTTGASTYSLPSDHLATIGVDYLADATNGVRRELSPLMVQYRNSYTGLGTTEAYAFALVGQNLVLYGTPPSGQTYYHLYIPQPPDLSSVADSYTVDVVTPDGEAFLIWGVAVQAKEKEESDTSRAVAEREAARERVMTWATNRLCNEPRRMVVDNGPVIRDPGDWVY